MSFPSVKKLGQDQELLSKVPVLLDQSELKVESATRTPAGVKVYSNESNFNPLYYPHILENVFTYLNFDDLKSCRLVCKMWEEEARGQLIPKSLVVIDNLKKMKKYKKEFLANENRKKLTQFTTALANSNNVHMNESKLIEEESHSSPRLNPSVVDFIVQNGKCIKVLTFDLARTPEPQKQQILQSKELGNLEKIIIKTEAAESGTGYRHGVTIYPISVFPSVIELEVGEHTRRFFRCSRDRIGESVPCKPHRLDDLIQALPNLKIFSAVSYGERVVMPYPSNVSH